ncbi:uncharacterized protein LOC113495662 isoform X1 [Trichoplusia ni]|uniref:Uncharacterized protein LOC113495662 isoform X1 n=1 Tax=Trichoplusia ni TaxID=7111 RepID=A0A7E5VPU9_TRINI|nr:uncharacterized protein LOC113495662 isoform X1 [Trichoplusia ni]
MLYRNLFQTVTVTLLRQSSVNTFKMDLVKQFQSLAWCKPDWCFPSMSKETNELLRQCGNLPKVELSDNVDELIARSKAFPIPFPIETVRLEKLKVRRPIEKLKKNIVSTYPLIHERVLLLMTHFLIYKREFGSAIEKEFYKDMSVPDLIDRILKKRAITFMGPADTYMLISGEEGSMLDGLSPQERKVMRAQHFRSVEGWQSVGTMNQRAPLLLENCLSYDEMKISAMVFVSGHTECINNGHRNNKGVVSEEEAEKDAVIIGAIGPRFERLFRMDFEDILITEEQNVPQNGYGEEVTPTTCLNVLKTTYVRNNQSAKHMWRQMWSEFYQVHSYTYEELTSYVNVQNKEDDLKHIDRYVKLAKNDYIFDNEVYYKRISIIAETVLLEAEARARVAGRDAYLNVIGCGLGVWKVSPHQADVYVLTFVERVRYLLRRDMLHHVTDVNFAYITPSQTILALFKNTTCSDEDTEHKVFFESKRHPRGGITVQLKKREPSAKLEGDDAGKLLVMTYPWDGNAHPGNEFWLGSLSGSGDPAAACSTQVSELHNAHINTYLRAHATRVAGATGLHTLDQHCGERSV